MCALWLAETFTATHTPGDTANHSLFISSYLICMCISARQNRLANQICMYTTCKSCPIVGELASYMIHGWRHTKVAIFILFELRTPSTPIYWFTSKYTSSMLLAQVLYLNATWLLPYHFLTVLNSMKYIQWDSHVVKLLHHVVSFQKITLDGNTRPWNRILYSYHAVTNIDLIST